MMMNPATRERCSSTASTDLFSKRMLICVVGRGGAGVRASRSLVQARVPAAPHDLGFPAAAGASPTAGAGGRTHGRAAGGSSTRGSAGRGSRRGAVGQLLEPLESESFEDVAARA